MWYAARYQRVSKLLYDMLKVIEGEKKNEIGL